MMFKSTRGLDTKRILSDIYYKLYRKDVDHSLNIFLCGSETGNKDSIRNLLHEEMKNKPRYNLVFPEFLFSKLVDRKKQFNLLKLEEKLASDVDIIILPLEGPGTLCELGAFAVNEQLLPKIVAINKVEYKNAKSFITIGPLALISA